MKREEKSRFMQIEFYVMMLFIELLINELMIHSLENGKNCSLQVIKSSIFFGG